MSSHPFWYSLIYTWVRKRYRTGLSLPFIVGAINQKEGTKASLQDIDDVIHEMATEVLPERITIMRCPDLMEPVFGLESRNIKLPEGKFSSENLFLFPNFKRDGDSPEELINFFRGE